MTVSETLAALKTQKGIEPKASYTGTEDTDDFIFAVQTDSSSQTKESAWIVCADHVKEDRHPAHLFHQRQPLRG